MRLSEELDPVEELKLEEAEPKLVVELVVEELGLVERKVLGPVAEELQKEVKVEPAVEVLFKVDKLVLVEELEELE